MGVCASRRNAGVEELDITMNNAYRYPPRSGKINRHNARHFLFVVDILIFNQCTVTLIQIV